jgi:hypothetical protein
MPVAKAKISSLITRGINSRDKYSTGPFDKTSCRTGFPAPHYPPRGRTGQQ